MLKFIKHKLLISGRKGSKEQSSPSSSEEFFQHFNKRKAAANCDTDVYNHLIKSPIEEPRPAKTCFHPMIKQSSTVSETKSCQTIPSDQDKSFLEKNGNKEAMAVPDLTQVQDMAPDITQVTAQSVIGNENVCSDNLPQVGGCSVNGVSMDYNSSKSKCSQSYDKDSAEQTYRKIRDTRTKSQSRSGNHLNNSYTDPYLDQSCYHQPSVNYYANSIYLGGDTPVFLRSADNQMYNNLYPLQSSSGNTANTPYLEYNGYYDRTTSQDSDIAYHGRYALGEKLFNSCQYCLGNFRPGKSCKQCKRRLRTFFFRNFAILRTF